MTLRKYIILFHLFCHYSFETNLKPKLPQHMPDSQIARQPGEPSPINQLTLDLHNTHLSSVTDILSYTRTRGRWNTYFSFFAPNASLRITQQINSLYLDLYFPLFLLLLRDFQMRTLNNPSKAICVHTGTSN